MAVKNPFVFAVAAVLAAALCFVPDESFASPPDAEDVVQLQVVDHQRASAVFAPSNSFSALLMFKAEIGLGRGATKCLLMNAGNGYYHGFRLSLVPEEISGFFHPRLTIGQDGGAGAWSINAPERTVRAGRWHRLAVAWDGRRARMYVDGKEVASGIFCSQYVPVPKKQVTVGASGESCGIRSLPFLVERAAVSARAMDAEEIAGWAAGAKPFEGDTPLVPEVVAKCRNGVPVPTEQIDSLLASSFHTPRAILALESAKVLSLVAGRRYAQAERLAQKVIAGYLKIPSGQEQVRDLCARIRDVKFSTGSLETLLDDFRADYAKARSENAAHLPFVALILYRALSQTGNLAEAENVRRAMKPEDFRRCPHLASAFGIDGGEPTAPRQKGASLSRTMPKKAFCVSPHGNDSADGSEAHPFRTLQKARAAVRKLKASGLPRDGVAVRLRGGTYRVAETLELEGQADSGTSRGPVVWCAFGDEVPVLDGGFEVGDLVAVSDPQALSRLPASARGHVRCCDVRKAGYRHLAPPGRYGFYCGVQEVTDLYQDGKRLTPARYPDEGWLQIGEVDAPAKGWIKAGLPDLRPWSKEHDLKATGFWKWLWADLTASVAGVDEKEGAFEIDLSLGGGKRIVPVSSRKFFLFNALCALDAPGEWYLDSRTGILYVWPLDGGKNARFSLSSFTQPFLRAKGVHHVRFEGLVFQNGRKNGIELAGCRDVAFSGNVVRRFGGDGMSALDGERMTVSENVFECFGHGALKVSGGDRRTLRHSGNVISNNDFSDVENRRRTYAPHLHLAGAGAEVSFNRFRNSPSSAIRLEGNDFLVTSNFVENVLLESDDQGALDIYFNASYFGNIYSYNTWKNIGRHGSELMCGQAAIRFDGNISGQTVVGNRFVNCGTGYFGAIQSCGGRLHFIDNNLFVNCSLGMSISHYPTNYWFGKIRPTLVKPCLEDVCITNVPYTARYQGIKDLLWTNQVSHLVGNIVVGNASLLENPPAPTVAYGNLHFAQMPDLGKIAAANAWRPIPQEDETGPRPTPLFRRALRACGVR